MHGISTHADVSNIVHTLPEGISLALFRCDFRRTEIGTTHSMQRAPGLMMQACGECFEVKWIETGLI